MSFEDVPLHDDDEATNPYRATAARGLRRAYVVGEHLYASVESRVGGGADAETKSGAVKWLRRHRRRIVWALVAAMLTVAAVVAYLIPSTLVLLVRRLVDPNALPPHEQWGHTAVVGANADIVEHIVEPTRRLSTVAELEVLYAALHNRTEAEAAATLRDAVQHRHYAEWSAAATRRANFTLAAARARLAADCERDDACQCVSFYHYGIDYNGIYVSAAALHAQRVEGAAAAVGTEMLAPDEEAADGGAMLYNAEVLAEDETLVREVRHQCDLRALLRAAARDGAAYVTDADRDAAPWTPYSASALVQYVAHNGLVRRRRVYLPAFACVRHCIEFVH